jgi:hypothetical protein
MEQVIWTSACPKVAVKKRITAYTETILDRVSRCGKRLKSFTLTHYWGLSALQDGFEAVGFEVVARIRGGLRVGVGTDLNAKILLRAGGDDEGGNFLWYHRDCGFRRLQMGPGIVDRQSICCTRRNGPPIRP